MNSYQLTVGRFQLTVNYQPFRFWETESGQELTTLKGAAKIITFDFHPREDVVVIGEEDGSVRVMQLKRGAAGRETAASRKNS